MWHLQYIGVLLNNHCSVFPVRNTLHILYMKSAACTTTGIK